MQAALLIVALLALAVVTYDLTQRSHAVLRNFPIVGHLRYLLERVGPELRQYIVTSDSSERPFSRNQRSWIYASAKGASNVFAYGTAMDLEWTPNEIIVRQAGFPLPEPQPGSVGSAPGYELPCAVVLGELHGRARAFRPASAINVSGMSFGALGGKAVEAMGRGCALAGCLQNTGEGGLSRHHLAGGADLVFQVGTGYFGVRDATGCFSMERMVEVAALPQVRAIEIKLSQGAKPGLGGMLPGAKVTAEIAQARGVPQGVDCISPPHHSQFDSIDGLIGFVEAVADATGLPVGIKSAVGDAGFWEQLASRMAATGAGPDFLTIDGGEGGTGAAPLVFTDHVALPFKLAFAQVYRAFAAHDMHQQVPLVGSGRLGFPHQALTAFALGCDMVNIGREAMLAIGCIQAQRCHTGHCPTGVTTHSAWRQHGLDVPSKGDRLARYIMTLRSELLALSRACGVVHPALVEPSSIAIIDDRFGTRALHEVFGYDPSWGTPCAADCQATLRMMCAAAAPAAG